MAFLLSKVRPYWRLILALSLALVAIGLVLSDEWTSDDVVLKRVEARIQTDLLERIQELKSNPPPIEAQRSPHDPQTPALLELDAKTGTLVRWTDHRLVPSAEELAQLLFTKTSRQIQNRDLVCFAQRLQSADANRIRFALLPLRIHHPVSNSYLEDYVFQGRYERGWWGQQLGLVNFSTSPNKEGLNFTDDKGQYLYGITLNDTRGLRAPMRQAALIFGLLSLLAFIGVLSSVFKRLRMTVLLREALVIALLFGLRVALILLHLPGQYLQSDLFSPLLLAIDELDPSLGDLTLNALLVLYVFYRLFLHIPVESVSLWLQRRGHAYLASFVVLVLVLSCLFLKEYFWLVDGLVHHSKVYADFADLTRLDAYSFLVYWDLAMILSAFFLPMLWAARVVLATYERMPSSLAWVLAGYLLGLLAGFAFTEMTLQQVGLCFFFLPIIAFVAWQRPEGLGFPLQFAFLLFAAFAQLTNAQLNESLEDTKQASMKRIANRYLSQRDLLSESLFESLVKGIQADRTLWDELPAEAKKPSIDKTINQLVYNHLADNFKSYDFQIYVFDYLNRRIDEQTEQRPYPLILGGPGVDTTLQGRFFYVRDAQNRTKTLYVGRFRIDSRLYGRLTLQIELHPKAGITGRLYPTLFLHQNIRNKLQLPPDFQLAIYNEKGNLLKQEGSSSFPLRLANLNDTTLQALAGKDRYLYTARQDDLTLVVRADRRSLFVQITTFSFLFYNFLVLYLLYFMLSKLWKYRSAMLADIHLSFSLRLQLFMVLLGCLPLAALGLLTSPLLENYFREDSLRYLRQSMDQLAGYLENNPAFLDGLRQKQGRMSPENRLRLSRVSNLLDNDINIYTLQGELFATTIPQVYQRVVSAPRMNPYAYEQFLAGKTTRLVLQERIGKLTYFAGYLVLLDNQQQPRGYLNLPYLSRQDLLESQRQRYIAYFINSYVVIILLLLVSSLFLSRQLANPLKLLNQKLAATNLGAKNETIPWNSRDEIGTLIASYNQMVEKLEASERKMAKTEREVAWREMARQVAHEIKNPLTPMRLSLQHLQRLLQTPNPKEREDDINRLVSTLITQIDSLTNIANSFSQFTTIDTGKAAPVELHHLLTDVAELYQGLDGLVVQLDLPPIEAGNIIILADRNQLNRALVNLVRNGIQAMNQQGTLRLGLRHADGYSTIQITDTGTGIPEDIRHRIFEPNFSTKNSGMGLGLAITRRIVEAFGGAIGFETELSKGTTFWLTFPLLVGEVAFPTHVLPENLAE
jgi:two-component system, NtrC family, nitrogen regulation sensor histidine kinase NtrY